MLQNMVPDFELSALVVHYLLGADISCIDILNNMLLFIYILQGFGIPEPLHIRAAFWYLISLPWLAQGQYDEPLVLLQNLF